MLQVTWVEHCEYNESAIHYLYRPLIRSGLGFGAHRWLANLQKQCDFLKAVLSSMVPGEGHSDQPLEPPHVSDNYIRYT